MLNQLEGWLTAIGTIFLGIVAAFQDKIRSLIWKPELFVSIETAPPDCHKTLFKSTDTNGKSILSDCYYFRLRIKNSGRCGAQRVEVLATKLSKIHENGSIVVMNNFIAQNLRTSFSHESFFETISPGIEKHFDLGHIINPMNRSKFSGEDNTETLYPTIVTVFSVDFVSRPYNMCHLIGPGHYKIEIVVGASNIIEPVKKELEISHKQWFDDEAEMFSNGIKIRIS